MEKPDSFTLLAVVAVHPDQRVRCQQPGCGHGVYARIHVVQEGDTLLVLGSDCFAKRYGLAHRQAKYTDVGSGQGRMLTQAERDLLTSNTQKLIDSFEQQIVAARAAALARATELELMRQQKRTVALAASRERYALDRFTPRALPHPWMRPRASVAYFHTREQCGWLRVTHNDGRELLMPHPSFEGWDEALPSTVGQPDADLGGYLLPHVPTALAFIRKSTIWEKIGDWREVAVEIQKRKTAD